MTLEGFRRVSLEEGRGEEEEEVFPAASVPRLCAAEGTHCDSHNSRTRGPAPMMMGNLNEEAGNHDASSDEFAESEDGELYRLEIRNGEKVFTKPQPD